MFHWIAIITVTFAYTNIHVDLFNGVVVVLFYDAFLLPVESGNSSRSPPLFQVSFGVELATFAKVEEGSKVSVCPMLTTLLIINAITLIYVRYYNLLLKQI